MWYRINRNMRCIEICKWFHSPLALLRLIETWDVLKSVTTVSISSSVSRLIETWDVLKCPPQHQSSIVSAINRNMRCIEISYIHPASRPQPRLIETWDVLKLLGYDSWRKSGGINRNMRCIEITIEVSTVQPLCLINRNMRCIEMIWSLLAPSDGVPRLIETWDVLKSPEWMTGKDYIEINRNMRCIEIVGACGKWLWSGAINRNMRCIEIHPTRPLCRSDYGLIETWDVLKSSRRPVVPVLIKINRNMRYIEIRQTLRMRPSQPRLIETWDVLKWTYGLTEYDSAVRLIETWDVLKCCAPTHFFWRWRD